MPDNLRTISNFDDFEKLLRKLCAFKGGWDNARHLLENANVLQGHLKTRNFEWIPEDIEKVRKSKSGQFLLQYLNTGESEISEMSAQLDYVRIHLGDFAIYGFKLQLLNKV